MLRSGEVARRGGARYARHKLIGATLGVLRQPLHRLLHPVAIGRCESGNEQPDQCDLRQGRGEGRLARPAGVVREWQEAAHSEAGRTRD